MKITPQDINNHEFKRSIRGYDMDEVDAFLTQVAAELELLITENQELKDGVKAGDVDLEEYRKKNELLQKTLLAAQDVTEKIKTSSQQEMEEATRAARHEAGKIINQANEEVASMRAQIDDLKRQRDAFAIQFKALLDTYYKFLSDLKKSDFESQSADRSRAAEDKTRSSEASITPAATSQEQKVKDGETAETSSDPIGSLQKLDFDDLMREKNGKASADDISSEE